MVPTKPCLTQRQLSLAYTPGVAVPCKVIAADASAGYRYTNRGNLVAVVSNGTAVLGLGNIGPLAGKPVMEGKGVLFKRFGHIDVFDIEVASEDPEDVIRFCQLLEPTVGGINLEDIKAPECFIIESRLKELMREKLAKIKVDFFFPPPELCTDNAAMIAAVSSVATMLYPGTHVTKVEEIE